jgi:multimeric flavodoxin WrbA
MQALILYYSVTGNTEKVASAIRRALEAGGAEVTALRVEEAQGVDLYGYDLVCLGAPVHQWLPAEPVFKFIKEKFNYHRKKGDVRIAAPRRPGKKGVAFVTYSGPHTGIDEAIPACKYMGQFFAHLGIEVAGEWYIIGEYHGKEDRSTLGPLGDIRGRPNAQDLERVEKDTMKLLQSLNKTGS